MMRMMTKFECLQFARITRRFGNSRAGHAGIMFSIMAMPLILAIGFVIDFTQANRYRSELQNVADAVALSAVRGLPISELQGQLDGKSLYDSLMSSIRAGLISDDIIITFEKTPDLKAFVEINAVSKGMFGNDIGLGPVRYEVNAEAILGGNETEVAMVVDLSASMVTSRMRGLGNAMSGFDKAITATAPAMSRVRIAVIPFAQTVTLPPYAANWLSDPKEAIVAATQPGVCFAAINTTTDVSVSPPSSGGFKLIANPARCMREQAFALSESFSQFRVLANEFKNPPAWRATWRGTEDTAYWGTAIYLGASWANRFLSESWSSHLPVASAPKPTNKASKFAIIMTDGDQLELDAYTKTQADAMLLSTCSAMRSNGVEVFTVGFSVSTGNRAILQQCASKADNFIGASNETELKEAFERIGRTVGETVPRLVF